jgi:membrane protein DedA with SNARE-associated domain
LASWVLNFVSSAGYWGIVALMFAENVFPPIPSEMIMPLAGYMVSEGKLSMVGVVVAGTAGSVLGAIPFYFLGYALGDRRLNAFVERHGRWLTLTPEDMDRARRWFDRHGKAAVMTCRLIPGIRSLISIPAGVARMPFVPFVMFTAAGTAIWAAALAYLGYFLESRFAEVTRYLDPVSWVVFALMAAIYVVRVVRR